MSDSKIWRRFSNRRETIVAASSRSVKDARRKRPRRLRRWLKTKTGRIASGSQSKNMAISGSLIFNKVFVLTTEPLYLEEELKLTEIMLSPPEADMMKAHLTGRAEAYDIRRAAAYLKLLRYSYSSGKKSFASQPFDIRRLFYLIWQTHNRLANVVVENQDFETLIHHYDRPDTVFYCDPPYVDSDYVYTGGFSMENQIRLRDLLFSVQGKFLLSLNDCKWVRDNYAGMNFFDFSRIHSMVQRYDAGKQFPELLIGNYDIYERVCNEPVQLSLFQSDILSDKSIKEIILKCKTKK